MPSGLLLKVTLTATNFIGYSSSATVEVKKSRLPVPTISIQGDSPRTTTHAMALSLIPTVELPVTTCVDRSVSNRMTFRWYETTGQYPRRYRSSDGSLMKTSSNPRVYKIPAYTLKPERTYTFEIFAGMTNDLLLNNTKTIDIYVQAQAPVAIIAGGSRSISASAALLLYRYCATSGCHHAPHGRYGRTHEDTLTL